MIKPRTVDPPNPPTRGGRPRSPDPGTHLSVWVPIREYDRLVALANRREQSVSALVRSLLILRLKP